MVNTVMQTTILLIQICLIQTEINKMCHYNINGFFASGKCLVSCDTSSLKALARLEIPTEYCADKIKLCCILEKSMKEHIKKNYTRISEEKCNEYSDFASNIISTRLTNRIDDGNFAKHGEFPHMAALGYEKDETIKWLCAGSLISEQFILTAAHCLESNYGYVKYVHLGNIDLPKNRDNLYNITKKFDLSYNKSTVYNDIALLKLNKPVQFTNDIKPACLSIQNFSKIEEYQIFATGWGRTELEEMSQTLKKIPLDLENDVNCSQILEMKNVTNSRFDELMTDSQFCCSGKYGVDTCMGDSGGPVQYFNINTKLHHIIGITSAGTPTCGSGIPGVYTKISKYIDWIETTVWFNDETKIKNTPIPYLKNVSKIKCEEYGMRVNITDKINREFSHVASLGYGNVSKIIWACSGSLISEQIILTTAFCSVHEKYGEAKYVHLGLVLRNKSNNIFWVREIHQPNDYKKFLAYNDIALLKLNIKVTFTPNIKPACLYTGEELINIKKPIAIGWNVTKNKNIKSVLKKVELSWVDNISCDKKYAFRNPISTIFKDMIHESQICATENVNKMEDCIGDLGGPLQYLDASKRLHTVVAVSSIRPKYCSFGVPVIYTKVSRFIKWIEHMTWPEMMG